MKYETELQLATALVGEASELARQVQDEVVAARESLAKDDRSPVTIADLAIQAVVSRRLHERLPADGLVGEEDSGVLESSPLIADKVLDLARTACPDLDVDTLAAALDRGDHAGGDQGRFWVLDPVDGTKGFLRGDQYAVALALVDCGQVVVGVLGCPNLEASRLAGEGETGCLFAATRDGGATMLGLDRTRPRTITVDEVDDPAYARLCESVEAAHAAHSEHGAIASRLGITSPSYRIDSQCKYGVVARGDASIYLRLPSKKGYREKIWDHAAGALVIEAAGGRVSDLKGRPLDFSAGRYLAAGRGIVATNGRIHDAVLEACREILASG